MKLKLMPNYLALKVEDTSTTKSGIVLSDTTTREKPSQGVITNAGDNDTEFKKGQVVLFEKYGAIELDVDGETVHLIDKRDVLAIVG